MEENLSSYKLFKNLKTSEVYNSLSRPFIIADDIRTPENMGAIIRLAANIGANEVIFISNNTEQFKPFKISKTASGSDKKVKWKTVNDFKTAMLCIPKNYTFVAIETSQKSENIYSVELSEKICFIVGNEVSGIRTEILTHANKVVHIPIPGVISSLNVTHALGIALFEWFRQMTKD
ncbi:MAG: TrmH family RNA methyltransferase [Marinilabiliales bacterium]|nr:MAG: TrmH family RNA methyltransferase [Marinilabiliales bacterium]